MARTINSPGVEIKETDLSLNASLPAGTNIFVQGYANQGPTELLLNVTSMSELEQVYGTPTNAAERYFYHTAKQVLESPGNLLCSRLAYGANDGDGTGNEYTALVYPVTSVTVSDVDRYTLVEPEIVSLTDAEYSKLTQGYYGWSTVSDMASTASAFTTAADLSAGAVIVINKLKKTTNQKYEGFYLGIRGNDNLTDVDSSTGRLKYDSVQNIYPQNASNSAWTAIPSGSLEVSLTGLDTGTSVSEYLDTIPTTIINTTEFDDMLVVGLFRADKSVAPTLPGEPVDVTLVNGFVGSVDANRKYSPNGSEESYFIEDIVNDNSMYIEVLVNTNFAGLSGWSNDTATIDVDAKALYSVGKTVDTSDRTTNTIGNLPNKLERTLRLAENDEQIPIDLVLDGGLSTIWANVGSAGVSAGFYDDTVYLTNVTEATGANTDYLANPVTSQATASKAFEYCNTIYNQFINFCDTTRRDCMFIADPLKNIFVQNGQKVLSDKSKNFSQHVYWPLRNLFSSANSSYAATYGNWVKVYDNNLGASTWLPFSGFQANIMAKLDSALYPWFAPAGLNNGVIRGITDIAVSPTQKQRDLLYQASINPVVLFPGDGFVTWGQKTLQRKPSAFDRINVRRLFLVLEKATKSIMRYFVFEPNTVFTRTRVTNVLDPIFQVPLNNEGIYEYLIVCDERNNTPAVIDNNELKVGIYIKSVRTAEYILVDFVATRTDQDFTELI